jgi:hypothetical protein
MLVAVVVVIILQLHLLVGLAEVAQVAQMELHR